MVNDEKLVVKDPSEYRPEIKLDRKGNFVDFSEIDGLKPVKAIAKKTLLTEEQVKASREYVREYVNNEAHVLAKGTQGSGKSKNITVAIKYLIQNSKHTNFVYSAESYDQKLDETWEDITGGNKIVDPFTGKEIEFDSDVKKYYLKGLNRMMKEYREENNLSEKAPLGIFYDRETGEETEFADYCKHLPMKQALRYAESPPDDFGILEKWGERKDGVREKAKSETPIIVVTPTAMRKRMSTFREAEIDWIIFGDEISYSDRETETLDLDEGTIEELKTGSLVREDADKELKEKVERLGEVLDDIRDGCKDFSLNDKPERIIKQGELKGWRQRVDRNGKTELHISKRIDLFKKIFSDEPGVTQDLMDFSLDNLYRPGKYWYSIWDDTTPLSKLVEEEMRKLLEDGKVEQAGKLNQLKQIRRRIQDLEKYGTFLNEKHVHGSQEVHTGLTPHRVEGGRGSKPERKEALLMTLKHELDTLFDQGFKCGNKLRILSASINEEWFRRKIDRYEESNNFNEELNYYFSFVEESIDENFELKIVRRYYRTSWAMGKLDDKGEFKEFSDLMKPYIEGDKDRHAIIPKQMKDECGWNEDSINCWNSDVLGSNDAEGKEELFVYGTYSPPDIEMVLTYIDLEGEFPSLKYNNGSSQIPEDNIEVDGRERTGYKIEDIEGESSLSVAYKCHIETHINDAIRRLRNDGTVYLMAQETEEVKEFEDDRVEEVRFSVLIADVIVDSFKDKLEQFEGQETNKLEKWIRGKGYDIGNTRVSHIAEVLKERMNWAIKDGVIRRRKTDEEKLIESVPKGKWMNLTEVLENSPFGYEKTKRIVNNLDDVEKEVREKPGPVPDKIDCFRFESVEK